MYLSLVTAFLGDIYFSEKAKVLKKINCTKAITIDGNDPKKIDLRGVNPTPSFGSRVASLLSFCLHYTNKGERREH